MSFTEITEILKVLGNAKRLKILIYLLNGSQSYNSIVNELQLKKTAISNHLTHLLTVGLIQRGDYGIYEITEDGIEFLKAIERAYQNSPSRQLEKFQKIECRKISQSFLNRFNNL
jgi:DNA-binding HxlR family transcriptional regulator